MPTNSNTRALNRTLNGDTINTSQILSSTRSRRTMAPTRPNQRLSISADGTITTHTRTFESELRAQRHRVLLELLAYEEGLMRGAWAAGTFDEERTFSLHPASSPTPAPGPAPPAPAAMPPVAAGATSNAPARPRFDPHGNGVRIGEADTPAPSAGAGDASAPAPPTASARPLDPILVQLLARLVGHVLGSVPPEERRALGEFCRDWRPAMAPAPAPSPAPAPTPTDAPAPAPAALALAPAPAHDAWGSDEWLPVR